MGTRPEGLAPMPASAIAAAVAPVFRSLRLIGSIACLLRHRYAARYGTITVISLLGAPSPHAFLARRRTK
jgi:hypothetical protein